MPHISPSLSTAPQDFASLRLSPQFDDALKEAYAGRDLQRSRSPVSPLSSISYTPISKPLLKRNTAMLPPLLSDSSNTSSTSASDHRMKPRVAVRDKTPHRFQVVPLREAQRNIPISLTSAGGTPWSRYVNLKKVERGGTTVRFPCAFPILSPNSRFITSLL